MTDQNETPRTPSPWKRRSALAGLALGALTVAGVGAYAASGDMLDGPRMFGHHTGGQMGGQMDGQGGRHGFMQKAKGGFMEYRMDRALNAVDATDEQKQKIKAIFEKARENMQAMRGEPGGMRDEIKAVLEKPVIDRDAVEAMRKTRVQKMDDASKIMTTAMIDAAEVLTPDQRAKLAKEIDGHGPRW